ncbi:hypothetical protein E4T56_gene16825 [Termitomyces sp. T112]|nr:hypothetical protein E4T56_gene16825 [Termitomyces sp. T112]KAH0579345.1 hypothetical protein H2248_003485 [Termitomyces sp. 'cryptogamus']
MSSFTVPIEIMFDDKIDINSSNYQLPWLREMLYVLATYGNPDPNHTFTLSVPKVSIGEPAAEKSLILPLITIHSNLLSEPIPQHTAVRGSRVRNAVTWCSEFFRADSVQITRPVECVVALKLASHGRRFRFLLDTGSWDTWLTSDYMDPKSRLPGCQRYEPPTYDTNVYQANPEGPYPCGRLVSNELHRVVYQDGSWITFKMYLDQITIQKKIDSSGDVTETQVPLLFGAAVDSYIGKPLSPARRPDHLFTFYDGILGLAPTARNRMTTFMEKSMIGSHVIKRPTLTISMSLTSGTLGFGIHPSVFPDLHGPIAITRSGYWALPSRSKKVDGTEYSRDVDIIFDTGSHDIHLVDGDLVTDFHRKIPGAKHLHNRQWAFPHDAKIPELEIQLGTGDSLYLQIAPQSFQGSPVSGHPDLCWSRLHSITELPGMNLRSREHDIMGLAGLCNMHLIYQYDTSMAPSRPEWNYVDKDGQDINTNGNYVYWAQKSVDEYFT